MNGAERIDDALVMLFDEGASYTGEDMAEIHCHGSPAILDSLLDMLSGITDCRLAEPGEFTRRALFEGRLDLSEAEGLSALIAAQTESQRRQAVRVFSGALNERVHEWRTCLLRALTLLEVTIDWVDEDVPEDVRPEVQALIGTVSSDLKAEFAASHGAQRLREGFEVAVLGPPNAGKSSLINKIASRDAAIVSDIPGTTRDVIEVRYDLFGLPVTFLDTAGLRETSDPLESMGIARTGDRSAAADLRVLLLPPDGDETPTKYEADLVVASKCDLTGHDPTVGELSISARTGEGVDGLLRVIHDRLRDTVSDTAVLTHRRHSVAVEEAVRELECAGALLAGTDFELVAHHLHRAVDSLEMIVGRIGAEDILDGIFGTFCLGK